jgi:hypothetical protein
MRPRRESDRFALFLAYLREIESALGRRDAMRVTALLRKRTATHMPREVREELLFLSRASRDSLRAPIQFLRFQHRMSQLAASGERLPTAQIELRFEARPSTGTVRRRDFDDRRTAAHEALESVDAVDGVDAVEIADDMDAHTGVFTERRDDAGGVDE